LGDWKGIRPVKSWVLVGGDDLTGALHDLALVVTATSVILSFNEIV